ncbi:MAG: PmoA family protein [Planctomycetaceae bacterium]|nr:PmoA family protein [Planctomycetaceae bacterium]
MLNAALWMLLQAYAVEKTADAVAVKSGDQEVLKYQLVRPADGGPTASSACYFHPLTTPKGVVVTDVAPSDHKHHRGIFLAWVEMHGKKDADFWGWGQYAPVKDRVIVNKSVSELRGGEAARFRAENDWMADGEVLVKEELEASLRARGPANVLDLVYTLKADADLKLPKWAFSGFCARLRKDGKATAQGPEGEVTLAAPHHLKPETDWPAQPWVGLQMALPDGGQAGAAVIDHSRNPPSRWHVLKAIGMLNPVVVADHDLVLKGGEPLVLRYSVVAWDGPLPRELLSELAAR